MSLDPTLSHTYDPYDFALPIIESSARFKVLIFHRKAGKTTLAINELIRWARIVPDKLFCYVAPTVRQAKEIIWKDPTMLFKYVDPVFLDQSRANRGKNEAELTLYFRSGSILYLKGADEPDLLRGPNYFFVVLDEYALMPKLIWDEIIQPVMRANKEAQTWFVGTPKPAGLHLKEIYEIAKKQENKQNWLAMLKNVEDTKLVSLEEIAAARKEGMTEAAIEQEFYCKFLEEKGVLFRKIDECCVLFHKEPQLGHSYQIGVDLGKYYSQTVISVLDLNTFEQVHLDYFDTVDWNIQKARIIAAGYKYNNARIIVDATGLGDPIVEDLKNEGLDIEGFKFSRTTKKPLIDHLIILMEQEKIKLLNEQEQKYQFTIYGFEKTRAGNIRYKAPEGKRDDIVHANALSVWKIPQEPLKKIEDPIYTPIPTKYA